MVVPQEPNSENGEKMAWGRFAVIGGLLALLGFGGEAVAEEAKPRISLGQNVYWSEGLDYLESETKVQMGPDKLRVNVRGPDNRVAADINIPGAVPVNPNLALGEIEGKKVERVNVEAGTPQMGLLGGGHQRYGNQRFWEVYGKKVFGPLELQIGTNSRHRHTAVAKREVGENDAVAVGLRTGEDGYSRVGVGWSHTGTVGLESQAIFGKNPDGTTYRSVRVRGGFGGKTDKDNIKGFDITGPGGTFNEELVEEETAPYWCDLGRTFVAPNVSNRGDPFGFEVQWKNDTVKGGVACRTGPVTWMPGVSYDTETDETAGEAEVHVRLPYGFGVKYQTKFADDEKPAHAAMVGYSISWGGKE